MPNDLILQYEIQCKYYMDDLIIRSPAKLIGGTLECHRIVSYSVYKRKSVSILIPFAQQQLVKQYRLSSTHQPTKQKSKSKMNAVMKIVSTSIQ